MIDISLKFLELLDELLLKKNKIVITMGGEDKEHLEEQILFKNMCLENKSFDLCKRKISRCV